MIFFDEKLLLSTSKSWEIYTAVKDLPIIDYHCHLDAKKIAENGTFETIGELWLANDHYKWRAMRLMGIDEKYITGDASFYDKFVKYAQILPNLVGNALYYWTHMELKQIFGIHEPLNGSSAERIWKIANEKLKTLSVQDLLKQYKVEYIATTDDPTDSLDFIGSYEKTHVAPTFRPDKVYDLNGEYLKKLAESVDFAINTLEDLLNALSDRIEYFNSKGCKISDHGFERFPKHYVSYDEAKVLFKKQERTDEEQEKMFGFLLVWLAKEYRKRNMLMQIHFSVLRNNNTEMLNLCGVDSGFDLIGEAQSIKDVVTFLNQFTDNERPEIVLYTLNDSNLSALAAVTGAFRHVRMGAAWWFNDTIEGIGKNIKTIAEYSALGSNLGMLTDSRSFSSYVRFDFFRRLLSDYLGKLVEKGECDMESSIQTAMNICYYNMKGVLAI